MLDTTGISFVLNRKLNPSSIGHPPHSLASLVELRLRVGPRALSGQKKELREQGVKNVVHQSVRPSVTLQRRISLG